MQGQKMALKIYFEYICILNIYSAYEIKKDEEILEICVILYIIYISLVKYNTFIEHHNDYLYELYFVCVTFGRLL